MIEYEPIGWVNGEEAETTPLNADNLNHMDEGIQAATNYLSETRDIADDTAARLALQIARLDVIVANMSTNTRTLTQAEYDALTEAEKNNNTIYFISDGGMNATTQAASIEYDNERSGLTGETVQAAIDENASAVAALNSSTVQNITNHSSSITAVETAKYVKTGKVVAVTLTFTVGSTISDTTAVLFSGLPNAVIPFRCFLENTSTTGTSKPARIYINQYGEIRNCYTQGGIAAGMYEGTVAYICQ